MYSHSSAAVLRYKAMIQLRNVIYYYRIISQIIYIPKKQIFCIYGWQLWIKTGDYL